MFARIGRYLGGRYGSLKAVAGRTGAAVTTSFRRFREPMQPDHLPQIDTRYWLAILLASVLGTVGGDFVSQSLGVGYTFGLPAMAAVFIASLYAEKVSNRFGEAFYWTAFVVTRMAATNLADLATHQLGFGFQPVVHVLSTALLLLVLWPRRLSATTGNTSSSLPSVDLRYWLGILTSSVLGTAMGDYLEPLLSGSGYASLMLVPLFALTVIIKQKAKLGNEVFYWIPLVLARTAGTAVGDYLAGSEGLGFGAGMVSVCTAIALAGLLIAYRQGKFLTRAEVQAFFAPRQVIAREGDDRFWVFAIISVAAGQMLIQWGYAALSVTDGTNMSNAIKPYIGGYEIGAQVLYNTWLLPFIIPALAAVLIAGKLTRRGKEIFYWSALFLTASVASSLAIFTKYAGGLGQPAFIVAGVCAPVLLALLWFTHRRPAYRFAQAVSAKGVSFAHCGLLLIAIIIGVAVGNDMGNYFALGYKVSAVAFLVPLWVVLYFRKRVGVTKTYMQESMSWLACVCAAVAGYPLGSAFESILVSNVGIHPDQTAEGLTPILLGILLAALIWLWRPGVPWQNLVASFARLVRGGVRLTIAYRRAVIGLFIVLFGLGAIYFGNVAVKPLRSPQEVLYNQAMQSLRTDLAKQSNWSAFVHPEVDLFQQSLQHFEHQRDDGGLINRLLYGEPDVVLASQANLKIGVILLYNAKDDTKLLNEAKGYLELAVTLNPGVPYANDLLAHIGGSTAEINRLALMALAPERDLEMLYAKNPQYRSKKPDKSKDGQGQDGKKEGDQQGQPDQPNDDPGKPSDQKPDKDGQASKNTTLEQNPNDVNGGHGNDGI